MRFSASVDHRAAAAALLCAVVFFLGSADLAFGVRAFGVNLRLANLVLLLGIVAWSWREGPRALADLRALAVGWGPFLAIFAAASLVAESPLPGLVKTAWFGFNMLGAYAWCRLFAPVPLARGFFACYAILALIVVHDFLAGFAGGPERAIGYLQPNLLVAGQMLYRPHAFHYEPSYAASALALACALALTRLRLAAPWLAGAAAVLGLVAVALIMSRTGWLYLAVFLVLLVLARVATPREPGDSALRYGAVAIAVAAAAMAFVLMSSEHRDRFLVLAGPLGVHQTMERVCPLVRDVVPALAIDCLDDEGRRRQLDPWNADREPEDTSEGQRVMAALKAVERIRDAPWLGTGVQRGQDRLIGPVASNVWLEIGSEGGLLSLAAFVWGLAWSLWRHQAFAPRNRALLVALLTYFLVAWHFLQTFPRLDQWLAFWFALAGAAAVPALERTTQRWAPAVDPP
jgi:hypothetical protein